ncbi:uncharacterized protein TM35_000033360 [Trypanosoma theileri]|uniref:Uncharacterized protein n=1 Tax=Trypanosoma theileri TaxID=67003 RepID=A0A1X0P7I5_9TRYP|nr:uncharacterized protein TM35_000033360 [Trypanosoma theileri]ORC92583.1 hypothetical protein TM35_000033360 [Trypanosoma theileri]
MAAIPNPLSSSSDVLSSQLKGVRAEPGALVSFRDSPAFEMVMRLNQRHKGKLVAAVLTNNESCDGSKNPSDAQVSKKEDKSAVTQSSNNSGSGSAEEPRLIFVPEAYEFFLDNEMQKWLDPFHGRGETQKQKKRRCEENEYSSGDDDIMDDSDGEGMNYSSSSSC